MSNKKYTLPAFAVLTVLMLFAVALIPIVADESEDVEEVSAEDIVLSGYYDTLKDYVFFGITAICPPIFLASLVAKYLDGMEDPADPTSGYPQTLRAHEAELTYTVLEYCNQLLANSLDGYSDIWKFTNQYWMRQAEVASAELYADGMPYNATTVTERSGLLREAGKLFDNIEHGQDSAFKVMQERIDKWKANDTYSQLKIFINYGSNNFTDSSSLDLKIRNAVMVSSTDADKVYISVHDNSNTTGTSDLWVWGGTATLTDKSGRQYVLQSGYNDLKSISGFESGVYELQSGRSYAGSIVPAQAKDAANVLAGTVIKTGSTYTLATYQNSKIYISGTGYDTFDITVNPGDSEQTAKVDLMPVISYQDKMITAIEESLGKAHAAAQAAYQIYDAAKQANVLISPSSLVPDLANVTVSSEQMYVLTILYMQQLHEYYERYGKNITASGYTLAPESVELYARGSIYDAEGTLLFENAVFTPYVWLQNFEIKKGTNTANQTGLVALWGDNCNDLTTWQGTDGNTKAQLVQMEKGYVLDVSQIMYKDAQVNDITLQILEIHEWDPVITPKPWDPQPEPKYANITPLVILIFILVAGYFAIAYYETDEWLFLLIAAIIAIIGIVGGSWIADLLVGLL